MTNTKFSQNLKAAADATQDCLEEALQQLESSDLVEGMRHAVRGGKCLRGFLVIETGLLYKRPVSITKNPRRHFPPRTAWRIPSTKSEDSSCCKASSRQSCVASAAAFRFWLNLVLVIRLNSSYEFSLHQEV